MNPIQVTWGCTVLGFRYTAAVIKKLSAGSSAGGGETFSEASSSEKPLKLIISESSKVLLAQSTPHKRGGTEVPPEGLFGELVVASTLSDGEELEVGTICVLGTFSDSDIISLKSLLTFQRIFLLQSSSGRMYSAKIPIVTLTENVSTQ